jgi:hypothetical protein
MVPVAGGGPAGGRVIARGGSNPSPSALVSLVNATLPVFTELPILLVPGNSGM